MTEIEALAVTGAGVVSPAGFGLAALRGWDGAAQPALSGPRRDEDYPPIPLVGIEGIDPEQYLGRKGVRHLDWTTKIALVACNRALAELDPPLAPDAGTRTGVVIGTSTGSIRSSSEFSRETLVQEKPYLVRANLFPNTVMNCCAGQVAIFNGLRGVNATIAGGQLSSLSAIRYARNAIVGGHIDGALVGGVEELCPQSAWGWHLSGRLTGDTAVGEGCAVFLVESLASAAAAGRTPLAELLACEVVSAGSDDRPVTSHRVTAAVRRALERSGVAPADVSTVSWGCTGHVGLERAELRGVRAALGGRVPAGSVRVTEVAGESFSASGALQLAALLAHWAPDGSAGEGSGEIGLVTSIGQDGMVGALVVRRR